MKFRKHWPLFWILIASCLQLFCGVARGSISELPTVETLGLTENGPWSSDTITYGYTYGRRTSLSVDRLKPREERRLELLGSKRLVEIAQALANVALYYGFAGYLGDEAQDPTFKLPSRFL